MAVSRCRLVRSVLLSFLLLMTACGASSPAQASSTPTEVATFTPTPVPLATTPPTATPDPAIALAQAYQPQRLQIAKLGLDAPMVSLGPDASGGMQAPRDKPASDPIWSQVFWWNPGFIPGQPGNAVIAGHVNRPDYSDSTFSHLNMLMPGDAVIVVAANGTLLHFTVQSKYYVTAYARGQSDPIIGDLFGPAVTANINLVTCAGAWDGTTFNQRLVVHAVLDGPSPFVTNGAQG